MDEPVGYRQYYDEFYSKGDFRHYSDWVNRALMKRLAERYFPIPGSILDLGCGTGVQMLILASLGRMMTGLDVSRVALRQASERCSDGTLIEGDAIRLPFKDDAFDGVISFGCSLMSGLLPGAFRGFLSEGVRVIRKGSWLLAVTRSDFSDTSQTGWKHATMREFEDVMEEMGERRTIIVTHPRLFPLIGRFALSRIVGWLLRLLPVRFSAMVILAIHK